MIEIEIWDYGKTTKQGAGPITSVIDFNSSERVNEAAQWSFTMPAEDDKAAEIAIGREAYGYIWERDTRLCVFGGEILELRRQETGNGGVDLTVSGLGKLNDLNYIYVDAYDVWDSFSTAPLEAMELNAGTPADKSNMIDGDSGTWASAVMSTGSSYLYLRHAQPFWLLSVTVQAAASGSGNLELQYYSRTAISGGGWNSVSGLSDGTASGGTMKVNGVISFTTPTDWDEVNHNGTQGYWLRLTASSAITASIQEIVCTTKGRNTDDINQLMTTYGGGMALIAAGGGYFTATANGYYGTISNTSTLGALRRIADIESGMFRMYAHDDARLAYMRASGISTGLYAVGPSAPSSYDGLANDQMLITGINQTVDGQEVINRLYAFGSGNGRAARVTLSGSDTPATSGYDRSEADSYIQKTTVTTRKSAGKYFPEIKDIEGSVGSPEAANMLLEIAENELLKRVANKEHLTLELIRLPQILRVGDKINVDYKRRARPSLGGAAQWVFNVSGEYFVTQVRHSVVNGVLVANVTASNITRPPLTIDEVLYRMVESLGRQLSTPQITRGADLLGPGVQVL